MQKWMFGILLAVLSACGGNTSKQPKNDAQTPENTIALLYETKCGICHGKDGNMGAGGARKLSESTLDKSAVQLQISNGKGAMPAFESQLSPEEISALADYVIALRK